MRKFLTKSGLLLLMLCVTSCAHTQTRIIDPRNSLLRAGPDVKGHVYVPGKPGEPWELSGDAVAIPAGYYITAPPKDMPAPPQPKSWAKLIGDSIKAIGITIAFIIAICVVALCLILRSSRKTP